MSLVYLDTNHISHLVRDPGAADSAAMLELLKTDSCRLGITMLHLYELSDPEFVSRQDVGRLLDQLELRWGIALPEVFTREIEAAFRKALTGEDFKPAVFFRFFGDATGIQQEIVPVPSEILEIWATREDLRESVEVEMERSARLDQLKRASFIARHRERPIVLMVRDRAMTETPEGLVLPREFPAEELVERAGGLPAFPAYEIWNALIYSRVRDPAFIPGPNDVVDEWHACYAPYVDAIGLDRRTTGRLRSTGVASAKKAAYRLGDVAEIARASSKDAGNAA